MKKIAFVTSNIMFAESLKTFVDSQIIKQFEFYLLFNPSQVFLDLEVLDIAIVLIDMAFDNKIKFQKLLGEEDLIFCKKIFSQLDKYRLVFLVSPNDLNNREIAKLAKREGLIEDFIFYDASLKYLLSKLSSI